MRRVNVALCRSDDNGANCLDLRRCYAFTLSGWATWASAGSLSPRQRVANEADSFSIARVRPMGPIPTLEILGAPAEITSALMRLRDELASAAGT